MKVYFLNLAGLKRLLYPAAACLVTLIFAFILVKEPPSEPVQESPQPVYKVKTNQKVAALTFNVSWGARVTGSVLDTLKKHDVKATFFVSGNWAKKYPEVAKRIVGEGHELSSYGDRQIDLGTESRTTIKEEIAKSLRYIRETTGRTTALMRPPYGDWSRDVVETAAAEGCTVVMWSVDSLDIQTPGVPAIVNNVVKKIHPGAIVLMNAGDTATQTPEALPLVLEGLKAEGYRLLTVQELLKTGPSVAD